MGNGAHKKKGCRFLPSAMHGRKEQTRKYVWLNTRKKRF